MKVSSWADGDACVVCHLLSHFHVFVMSSTGTSGGHTHTCHCVSMCVNMSPDCVMQCVYAWHNTHHSCTQVRHPIGDRPLFLYVPHQLHIHHGDRSLFVLLFHIGQTHPFGDRPLFISPSFKFFTLKYIFLVT